MSTVKYRFIILAILSNNESCVENIKQGEFSSVNILSG